MSLFPGCHIYSLSWLDEGVLVPWYLGTMYLVFQEGPIAHVSCALFQFRLTPNDSSHACQTR